MNRYSFLLAAIAVPLCNPALPADAQRCQFLPTLSALVAQDQQHYQHPSTDNTMAMVQHRYKETLDRLVACDALHSAQDWINAAGIMQHSDDEDDLITAMEYGIRAKHLEPGSRMAAQAVARAWDKLLVGRKRKQWYGMQFDLNGTLPVAPCVITTAERQALGMDMAVITQLATPSCH